ncbi:hypothetical protein C3F09_01980 [candidate division GN15 bacterium]|uniref:Lipoprotein n=1 Tax=candidate division GN15 bacterium TaxID=2072418 RepID=A0A855XBQ3_9BACT|nr:MAG: hypothetical protein C3F09_01980 [candidate division GN15 bacterium]
MKRSTFALLLSMMTCGLVIGCDEEKPAEPTGDEKAWTFNKISGDGQDVRTYDTLASRMVVELMDGLGEPVVNEQLRWEVQSGAGEVTAKPVGGASPAEVLIPTDFNGRAALSLRCYDTGAIVVTAVVVARPTLSVQFSATGIQP